MKSCLELFERGWLQLPKDEFLWKGVLLLRSGPKVAEFQGLCQAELKRFYCRAPVVKLPYSLQSGWVHNVRLAKSMVLWVLSGRQSLPARLPRGKQQITVAMTTPPNDVATTPLVPMALSWEDRMLNLAWQMLQHVLARWPPSCVLSSHGRVKNKDNVKSKTNPPLQLLQPLFYPAQMDMAERLYDVLFNSEEEENEYEEMDFRILLPPSVSLQKQTEQRLMQVFGKEGNVEGKVLNRCMFRSGVANEDFKALERAVMERDPLSGKKKRMMVVVVDECHVGIGRGGQMDVLMNGAAHKASGIECNAERILQEDNVYVVYVSATGWNCVPGVLPEKTVIWNEDPTGYTGWKSYATSNGCNRDCLKQGEVYQGMLDYFRALFRDHGNGGSSGGMDPEMFALLPSLVLMVDYALGFVGSALCSSETRQIVSDHNVRGFKGGGDVDETTMIRVQQNGAQGAMVRWLQYFLQEHARSDSRVETSLDRLKKDKVGVDGGGGGRERSFCVLVEKGRFGDSFPGRLLHYDLRARYQSATCTFSSLLQDVGRCFGYRANDEAPLIVLNPQGYRLFMGQGGKMVVDRYLNKQGNGPNRKSMWFEKEKEKEMATREDESFKTRWALLLAQPQVGKTGVYLRLLQMVKEHFGGG